jgi:hypothetical protein
MSTVRGNVSLTLALQGQESISRSLKSAQKGLDDTGKSAKDAASSIGTASGTISGQLSGLPGKITDINSAFSLVQQGIGLVTSAWQTFYAQIKEGEIAANAGRIFDALTENAGQAMDKLRDASRGIVDDTSLQQAANRLKFLGFEVGQTAVLIDAAIKTQIATGDDWKGTLNQLSRAIITGREASLDRLGVLVDLEKEEARVAFATGRSVEELTKAEKIQTRLIAVTDELSRKFSALDFDKTATDAQQFSTAIANQISNFQVWLAESVNGAESMDKVKASTVAAQVQIDEFSETLQSLAVEAYGAVGTSGEDLARKITGIASQIVDTDAKTARALKAQAAIIQDVNNVTAKSAKELGALLDSLSVRRREIIRKEIDAEIELAHIRQARIETRSEEEQLAIEAQEKLAEEAAAKKKKAEEDAANRAKGYASKRRQQREAEARLELEIQLAALEESGKLGQIEARKERELFQARQAAARGDLSARAKELTDRLTLMRAESAATAAMLDDQEAADKRTMDMQRAMEDARLAQSEATLGRDEIIARARLAMREDLIRVERDLQDGAIDEELAAERRRLAELEYLATEREYLQRRAVEQAEQARMDAESAIVAFDSLASRAQRSSSVLARLASATTGTISAIALQSKELARGSSAAILAISERATAAIASEKAQAAIMAAVATATALLEAARGNAAGAAAGFASAAAFAAVAGSSAGGGGPGGGGGVSSGPSLIGAPSASFNTGSSGPQTFIVEGWRGQDLVGQMAGDADAARRNGVDRRRM